MNASHEIRKFLVGETDIMTFWEMYDSAPAINDFLQELADKAMRTGGQNPEEMGVQCSEPLTPSGDTDNRHSPGYFRCSVREYLMGKNPASPRNLRAADSAWIFYARVHELYTLCDPTVPCCDQPYREAYAFTQRAIPKVYRSGQAERYIQDNIIPCIPDTLSYLRRVHAIRAAIKREFKAERHVYPNHPGWPMGKDGKPTTFIGREKRPGQDEFVFFFRDETDGTIIPVEEVVS